MNILKPRLACALLCLLSGVSRAPAGVNSWTMHGPHDGGASVGAVAAHPTNGLIALATTSRGFHRTVDGGQTWVRTQGVPVNFVRSLYYDPTNSNRVIANDGSLYMSEDGGQNFGLLQTTGGLSTGSVADIAMASNGTLYAINAIGQLFRAASPLTTWTALPAAPWPSTSWPQFLRVDPANPQVVYVGLYPGAIYRSTDGGTTWSGSLITGIADPSATSFIDLDVDPSNTQRVLLAAGDGLYESNDRGDNWSLRAVGTTHHVAFDPEDPAVVLALRYSDVIRSGDHGHNWTVLGNHRLYSVSNLAFIAGSTGGVFMASSNGIGYSTNSGLSWAYQHRGLRGFQSQAIVASDDGSVYAAMSIGFGDIFRRNGDDYYPLDTVQTRTVINGLRHVTSLAVSATDSRQIFAVNMAQELLRTFDRGASWTTAHPQFYPGSGDWIHGVTIDPANPQVAYVGRAASGIWKTTNAGATFVAQPGSPAYAYKVAVSPHDSNVLFAAGGASSSDSIYGSIDGGATWTLLMPPVVSQVYRQLNNFAFHPTDPRTVYATAYYGGVYRTTDGGATWTPLSFASAGDLYVPAQAVLIDPVVPSTLIVVSSGMAPGFLRSVDNGATWRAVHVNLSPQFAVYDAILDPQDPANIIARTGSADIVEYRISPDLSLALTSLDTPQPNSLPASSVTTATFTVANVGPHASSASELVIDVPAWITPSGPNYCTRAGQTLRCALGALRVNDRHTVTVDLAAGATPGTGQLSARITGHERDWESANDLVAQSISSTEIADLEVTIASGAQSFDRGAATNATVTVRNDGPSPSTATQLTLQLPANLIAQAVVASRGSCTANAATITCSLGTINAGESANIAFDLHGESPGQGTLSASVDGAGTDPDGLTTAMRTFTVRPVSDMSVSLAESADPVTVGTPFQYVATVTNLSGDGGEFTVAIPVTGAQILNAVANFGSCTETSGTVTCTGLGLAAGASGTVTIVINGVGAGIATAAATLTFNGTDTNPANNTANIGTTLRLVGDLSVSITDSADPAPVDLAYSYTVTVRNDGPNAGPAQVAIAAANTRITGASSPGAQCTFADGTASCAFASLSSGASAPITVSAISPAAGNASLTATAIYGGMDVNAANDTATANTVIQSLTDLSVEIADSADPVTVSQGYNYTATVRNLGPNAGAARLTVALVGASISSVTPSSGGTCTNTTSVATCDFAMTNGAAATAVIAATAAISGAVRADATVTSSGLDALAANNTASQSTTINAAPSSSSGSGSGGGSSGGGGGGGGRFDWLLLGALGLIAGSRRLQTVSRAR